MQNPNTIHHIKDCSFWSNFVVKVQIVCMCNPPESMSWGWQPTIGIIYPAPSLPPLPFFQHKDIWLAGKWQARRKLVIVQYNVKSFCRSLNKQSVSIKESGMKRKRGWSEFENGKTFCEVIVIVARWRVNITNCERFRRIVLQIKMLRFHMHGN